MADNQRFQYMNKLPFLTKITESENAAHSDTVSYRSMGLKTQ